MNKGLLGVYLEHRLIVVPVKIEFINDDKHVQILTPKWEHLRNISFDDYICNEFHRLDFSKATHVGIVLPSSGLVLLDYDDTKHMPTEFVQNAYEVAERYNLVTINTGSGMHLYFRRPNDEVLRQIPRKHKEGGGVVEFNDYGLAFAPLYENEIYYTPVRFFGEGTLIELTPEILTELQIPLQPVVETHKLNHFIVSNRRLDDEKINTIADLIEPHYVRGQRNNIVFALSGMLRKLGVSYEDALQVVKLLIERTNDEEPRNRIDVVRRTYTKPLDDAELLGSSGLLEIIGDKSVIYQIYHLVKGEPLRFDETFIRLFATTRWWLKQIEDIVKQNYIALTDNEGQVTLVRKFDAEKGVWLKIKDFKGELVAIIKGLMDEWEDLLLNADCDEKTKYNLLYKLFKTQPQREVNEIHASLLQDITINAEDFYAPPPFLCSVCKDNIINIVACETHFIFVCKCGHIDLVEKSAIENPKSLRVFTYIPAALPADPAVAYEWLQSYGWDLMHTLLRVAAYVVLSRNNFKRKIFVFTGVTSSGKTSFCELLKHVVNRDYHSFAANALTVKGDATHAVRATLASHKIAVFSELPPVALSNENFKLLTDQTIPARFLYKNPADFYNISNIIITTNYNINTNSIDAAVVERVVLVCFERMFYNSVEVAQYYVADEKQKAIENFAQRLWSNKQFANSFLAAILQAWRDLCNDDFQFQVDEASRNRQKHLLDETLSVDAFAQFLEIDYDEYYPTAIIFDLYRRFCQHRGVTGINDIKHFGQKFAETAVGKLARKKLLRKSQVSPTAMLYAVKFGIKLFDDDTNSETNATESNGKKKKSEVRRQGYSLKPSQKLLKLLGIDLSDDSNPQPPAGMFEDDTDEQDEKYVDTEQFIDEAFPTEDEGKIEETATSVNIPIPQNCTLCGNKFRHEEGILVCDNCQISIFLSQPPFVVVEEFSEPESCIICGAKIEIKQTGDRCKNCGIEYHIRLAEFPF